MTPNRLPDLTRAQKERVRLFRAEFRHYGKVSVIRKGQKHGHILISVSFSDRIERHWYGRDGLPVYRATEHQLFEVDNRHGVVTRHATNPFTED